jgi:hypothetical protein
MAILHYLLPMAQESVGFLLPVFRAYRGSNTELIQRIDDAGNVTSFDPILHDHPAPVRIVDEIEAYVGKPAVWAFCDNEGNTHVGERSVIQAIGIELLIRRKLDAFPMAAAEMVTFCQMETRFAQHLQSALSRLSKLSGKGAETWLDTCLLLPAIKEDLVGDMRSRHSREQIMGIFAISKARVTHIYLPKSFSTERITRLPRWAVLAQIFGIERFEVHILRSLTEMSDFQPNWILYGNGGIARLTLGRAPFFGTTDPPAPPNGAVAYASGRNMRSHGDPRLIVAITTSDPRQAALLQSTRLAERRARFKHLLNIRPIGFGTPRGNRLKINQIRLMFDQFDCVWILANHRQRQTGSYLNSLSASNTASRFVKAASLALIHCLGNERSLDLLEQAGVEHGYGLIGAARYDPTITIQDMLRRVLYSMLCEDAYLHSASRIAVLWPYRSDYGMNRYQIRVGREDYEVDLVERRSGVRTGHVVAGFALNVRLAVRSETDFRDFLTSLLAGYGWVPRHDDGRSILLENEGSALRVWPVTSIDAALRLLNRKSEYGSDGDLIISNQTISRRMRSFAEMNDWQIFHYSELSRFMRSEYQADVFRDL